MASVYLTNLIPRFSYRVFSVWAETEEVTATSSIEMLEKKEIMFFMVDTGIGKLFAIGQKVVPCHP
jgi:hypothetical protein